MRFITYMNRKTPKNLHQIVIQITWSLNVNGYFMQIFLLIDDSRLVWIKQTIVCFIYNFKLTPQTIAILYLSHLISTKHNLIWDAGELLSIVETSTDTNALNREWKMKRGDVMFVVGVNTGDRTWTSIQTIIWIEHISLYFDFARYKRFFLPCARQYVHRDAQSNFRNLSLQLHTTFLSEFDTRTMTVQFYISNCVVNSAMDANKSFEKNKSWNVFSFSEFVQLFHFLRVHFPLIVLHENTFFCVCVCLTTYSMQWCREIIMLLFFFFLFRVVHSMK